jgi:hypothetical protein
MQKEEEERLREDVKRRGLCTKTDPNICGLSLEEFLEENPYNNGCKDDELYIKYINSYKHRIKDQWIHKKMAGQDWGGSTRISAERNF